MSEGVRPRVIVPAAGASSRMGDWKPLLPWGESTVIEAVVANALAAGLEVVVVTGHRGGELRELLDGMEGLTLVDNPRWKEGMLGSTQAGLAALVESGRVGEAFFVTPADMPLIGPELYRQLAESFEAGPGAGATCFAACEGRLGHPVLMPASFAPDLLRLDPGGKLRDFLMTRPWRLVETGDLATLADLDTPDDYRRARPAR